MNVLLKTLPVFAAVLLFLSFPDAGVQPAFSLEDPRLARSERLVEAKLSDLRKTGAFPGATFSFLLSDGRSGSVAVGYSDLEAQIPMRPNDKMLSGSIGKTYAAAVMLQLVQEGKARLDQKVADWLGTEAWFKRLANWNDITLRSLMNHTSGIPDHVENKKFVAMVRKDPTKTWKPEEIIATILDEPAQFPTGKGWAYTDSNYILVGMIIERITQTSYYDELTRRILRPLALNSTLPSNKRVIPGLVSGYTDRQNPFNLPEKVCVSGRNALNPEIEWTGGGLVSTSLDMARWVKALYGGKVLAKSSLLEMLSGVDVHDPEGDKYGLAVEIRNGVLGVSYGHGGDYPGFRSSVAYFPKYDLAVAIQINKDTLKDDPYIYLESLAKLIVGDQFKKN